jgi:hypothetical protein
LQDDDRAKIIGEDCVENVFGVLLDDGILESSF